MATTGLWPSLLATWLSLAPVPSAAPAEAVTTPPPIATIALPDRLALPDTED